MPSQATVGSLKNARVNRNNMLRRIAFNDGQRGGSGAECDVRLHCFLVAIGHRN